MKKNLVWLSYDLSFKGDYERLYCWLDSHDAKECGDSVAALFYEYENDLVEELCKDLRNDINFNKEDRVYIIYRNGEKKLKGKFIIGRRKPSPWVGYAGKLGDEDESEG